jgi:predicted nucleotidyltransferase
MNIKITKEQHERLQKQCFLQIPMGSYLYGTNNKDSDLDILCIYKPFDNWTLLESLPNHHQFQYDDEETNTDFIYCTEGQFWKNQRSGDSTINSDVVMFSDEVINRYEDKINYCRTQKVIKGYIGFANRDIKQYSKTNSPKKYSHIVRGLITAECLIDGKLPKIKNIKEMNINFSIKQLQNWQTEVREKCNTMYEKKELENYYIEETEDELLNILLISNNTREFIY